jgi:hypothetical protein
MARRFSERDENLFLPTPEYRDWQNIIPKKFEKHPRSNRTHEKISKQRVCSKKNQLRKLQ